MPLVGRGIARTQPIWAEDAADCVLAALERPPDGHVRYELAGPETLTQREVVRLVLAAVGPAPARAAAPAGRACAPRCGPRRRSPARPSLITWDEAQLLAVEMLSARGTADAEALGVTPAPDGGGSGRRCAQGCAYFELPSDLQQPVLGERPADDLDAGRQPVGAEPDRHARSRAGR